MRIDIAAASGSNDTTVSNSHPLPVTVVSGGTGGGASDTGVQGVTAVSTAGRGVILIVTAAGNVDFTFADASTLTNVPVAVGLSFLPFSVTAVAASGSGGATFTARGAK